MTPALVQQRCFHHLQREAAFRCPGCRRYFCRECGAEHDDRMLCTACLKKLAKTASSQRSFLVRAGTAAAPAAGLLIAWMVFYYLGQVLLLFPAEFHGGR